MLPIKVALELELRGKALLLSPPHLVYAFTDLKTGNGFLMVFMGFLLPIGQRWIIKAAAMLAAKASTSLPGQPRNAGGALASCGGFRNF